MIIEKHWNIILIMIIEKHWNIILIMAPYWHNYGPTDK